MASPDRWRQVWYRAKDYLPHGTKNSLQAATIAAASLMPSAAHLDAPSTRLVADASHMVRVDALPSGATSQIVWQKEVPNRFRAYNPQWDIDRMVQIQALKDTDPAKYQQELNRTLNLVRDNWRTFLAELYGVAVHKSIYSFEDGVIKEAKSGEVIITMLQKGIDKMESTVIAEDVDRNKAEKQLFELLTLALQHNQITEGDVLLLPTLQGSEQSVFRGNYIDVLVKVGHGFRVERYASNLNAQQMVQAANELAGIQIYPKNATAVDLKERYANIGKRTIDEVKSVFQLGAHSISDEKFAEVEAMGLFLVDQRFNLHLQEVPPSFAKLDEDYRGIINITDTIAFNKGEIVTKRTENQSLYAGSLYAYVALPREIDFDYYASQRVMQRQLPCGEVGGDGGREGFEFTGQWTVSTVDFGSGDFKLTAEEAKKDKNLCPCGKPSKPHFHCGGKTKGGECKQAIIVGAGTTHCPACGKGKVC